MVLDHELIDGLLVLREVKVLCSQVQNSDDLVHLLPGFLLVHLGMVRLLESFDVVLNLMHYLEVLVENQSSSAETRNQKTLVGESRLEVGMYVSLLFKHSS